MSEMSRRDAMTLAAAATAACACCALGADEKPAEGEKDAPAALPKQFPIGKLADYPNEGFYDTHRKSRVFISRLEDRLVVMSAICTHKNCVLRKSEEKVLRCPCHKSFFSEQGTPTEGQAKVALPRYAVKQDANGTITVDTTKSYGEREWDQPEAFISTKPA